MSLKIEVGDKVRIVRVPKGKPPRWGAVGDVGVVKSIVRRSVKIVGVGDGFEGGRWHTLEDLALFADELKDMPPDTVVSTPGDMWLGGHPQYMDRDLICCGSDACDLNELIERGAEMRRLRKKGPK